MSRSINMSLNKNVTYKTALSRGGRKYISTSATKLASSESSSLLINSYESIISIFTHEYVQSMDQYFQQLLNWTGRPVHNDTITAHKHINIEH